MREMFALANKRADGSPALSYPIESFALLLDLGARGGLYRITAPYREGPPDGNGTPTRAYFVPIDPLVWDRGQSGRMVQEIILAFLESGEKVKPSAKKPKAG
jgi:hypothetical protein